MDGLYVFNNPWAIQSMEKHTSYCAMMRLGMPIPETWIVPPKDYEFKPDLADHARSATPGCSTSTRSARRSATRCSPSRTTAAAGPASAGSTTAPPCTGPTTRAAPTCCTCNERSSRTTCSCAASGSGRRPGSSATTRRRRCTTATRWTTVRVPDDQRQTLDRHDADDQLVLRVGVQLVRGAAPGRHLAPDRLRQRLPRLAGDVAALPLPVARGGQPAVVDLLRGDEAPDADQPRLGAVLRDRRLRRARTPRSSPATRRSPASASRPPSSSRSARPTCRTSTRSCGSSSPPTTAYDAVRQKVAALFPAHEVEQFTDLFWDRIQHWRHDSGRERLRSTCRRPSAHWYSERVERDVDLVRWGSYGTPVLVFPTAGGDAEEIERFHLVDACARADRRRPGEAVLRRQRQRPRPAGRGGRQRPAGVDPAAVLRSSSATRSCRRSAATASPTTSRCWPAGSSIGAFNALDVRVPVPRRLPGRDLHERHVRPAPLLRRPARRGLRRVVAAALPARPRRRGARPAAPAVRRARQRRGRQRGHRRVVARWPRCSAARASPTASTRGASEWPHDWPLWRAMLPQYLDDLA